MNLKGDFCRVLIEDNNWEAEMANFPKQNQSWALGKTSTFYAPPSSIPQNFCSLIFFSSDAKVNKF